MPPDVTPLDRDAPPVRAARSAERAAYRVFGYAPAEHYVRVPELDCEIRVLEVGSGPPLVLLPGGHGPGMIWIPLLSELDDFTAYVMDRPGGGLSDGIDYRSVPWSRMAATSTAALFDHFELEEAPIVGNSMGGLWALRFTLAHPDRVSALVLPGCPAMFPGTSAPFPMRLASLPGLTRLLVRTQMQSSDLEEARATLTFMGHPRATAENLPEEFAEAWYRMENTPQFETTWLSLVRSGLRLWGAAPQNAFTPDDLEAVRAPVSLLWGSDDPFGALEKGRAGAKQFREAEFHEVGTGHLPWLDAPETTGRLIRAFVAAAG